MTITERLMARLRRMVSGQHIEPERPSASGVRARGAYEAGIQQLLREFEKAVRELEAAEADRLRRLDWPETGSTDPRTEDPGG